MENYYGKIGEFVVIFGVILSPTLSGHDRVTEFLQPINLSAIKPNEIRVSSLVHFTQD